MTNPAGSTPPNSFNLPNTPKTAPKRGIFGFFRSGWFKFLILPLLASLLLFSAYIWAVFQITYSDGERAGFVQKLSRKGWLCKTWEGELTLIAIPGAMPEKFFFTVRSDALAAKLNAQLGQRVAVTYDQHKGLPGTCFGETEYFLRDSRTVANP
ncbi:MAG TPA: hypothetical protein PK372_07745 [Rugosibacter sp.]|nr:hypothetical protein [Rugosibacter sp.]HPB91637.1 hypothetical protein [Rugosibacter sp.]HQQ35801.1 hypothetical protein [Rugosibacter sp.]